jgi:hypothetical protein
LYDDEILTVDRRERHGRSSVLTESPGSDLVSNAGGSATGRGPEHMIRSRLARAVQAVLAVHGLAAAINFLSDRFTGVPFQPTCNV